MFSVSQFLRQKQTNPANDHGFNVAYLGLDKLNPYPVNSNDHVAFEHGWKEGQESVMDDLSYTTLVVTKDIFS